MRSQGCGAPGGSRRERSALRRPLLCADLRETGLAYPAEGGSRGFGPPRVRLGQGEALHGMPAQTQPTRQRDARRRLRRWPTARSRARALGWTAEGCELSDATAQAARSKGFAVFTDEWHQKLSADRYDLVMMSNVLEHLHTPGPALNAIARALRRDGVTLITLPNFGSAQAKTFGGRWWALLPPEHVWYYRLDHVTAVLRAAGIEVRAVRTQSVVTGVLAPSTVRLQWRTWRLGGGSIPRFCRLFVHGLAVPPGIGPDSVTVARSPLYTLECVRAPRA